MKLLLIPLTQKCWSSPEMALAIEQALDAARRVRKNLDSRRERIRFSLACDRIETLALREMDDHSFTIEGAQAQSVMDTLPTDGKARFPFVSPSDMSQIRGNLPGEILNRLGADDGLVLMLVPFENLYVQQQPRSDGRKPAQSVRPRPDYSLCEAEIDGPGRNMALSRIHNYIRTSIETGRPVGWVNMEISGGPGTGLVRHETLTRVLREYINLKEPPTGYEAVRVMKVVPDDEAIRIRENKWWYKLLKDLMPSLLPTSIPTRTIPVDEKRAIKLPVEPIFIRFAFKDGSESAPFPLLCLLPVRQPEGLKVIRAALMSGRHFELDSDVDLCILRNSEMNRAQDVTIAEQERIAFEQTSRFISGLLEKINGLELHLYHTGLEPAVIGTYRAIIEALRTPEARGRFIVIPRIFRGNRYEDLKPWY